MTRLPRNNVERLVALFGLLVLASCEPREANRATAGGHLPPLRRTAEEPNDRGVPLDNTSDDVSSHLRKRRTTGTLQPWTAHDSLLQQRTREGRQLQSVADLKKRKRKKLRTLKRGFALSIATVAFLFPLFYLIRAILQRNRNEFDDDEEMFYDQQELVSLRLEHHEHEIREARKELMRSADEPQAEERRTKSGGPPSRQGSQRSGGSVGSQSTASSSSGKRDGLMRDVVLEEVELEAEAEVEVEVEVEVEAAEEVEHQGEVEDEDEDAAGIKAAEEAVVGIQVGAEAEAEEKQVEEGMDKEDQRSRQDKRSDKDLAGNNFRLNSIRQVIIQIQAEEQQLNWRSININNHNTQLDCFARRKF
eukprot:CAMPEP_0198131366 /NCGR_PEP_ID=MMETSP1442-20131203/56035_1 /TAXON_ID= /ORGANISM="Craspedostauros australis, Strain CCMP3328" /LENGTH=361 /DNA_ID=CAMNT_0043792165 /DNA_START=6 /DNA_END=1093 /DNA_ORIENTATION=-